MASSKATGPTVGLDIGSAFIKAVEVRPGRGGAQVAAIGIMPTPANTFAGDVISDPMTLGMQIKRLLQESGITAKTVVACVSGQASFVIRVLPVPKMTAKELIESMRWEVERHVPFRPDEIIKDFAPLPSVSDAPDSSEMSVLLAVGQKQLVDNLSSTLLFAGLTPAALDVETLSMVRTVPIREIQMACAAMVNVGASKTDVGVFDRGVLVYPRSFPIAGNNFTRSVADVLGLPTEQAERLKVEYGQIPESRDQVQPAFDGGNAFGGFDLPDTGAAFGAPDPFVAPTAPAPEAPEPTIVPPAGGFAEPADEAVGLNFGFHDEEDAAPAPGGFAFTLDDPEVPETSPPPPSVTPTPPPTPGPADLSGPSFVAADPFAAPSAPGPASSLSFESSAAPAGAPIPLSDEEARGRQISDALVPVYHDLAQELRRSLDYYSNRPGGRAVERVYLCGGTARLRGLAHALEQDLGLPVQVIDPSRTFPLAGKAAQPGYYAEVGPVAALAIGLGIRDLVADPGPPALTAGGKKK